MQLNVSDVLFCFSVVFLCVCLKLRKKENNVCCCPRSIVVYVFLFGGIVANERDVVSRALWG